MKSPIFVTGMARSGTTLLARLAAQERGEQPALQPLGGTMRAIKADFLSTQVGVKFSYPINDQQFDAFTPPERFTTWLEHHLVDQAQARSLLDRQAEFQEQAKLGAPCQLDRDWPAATFPALVPSVLGALPRRPTVWKEIVAEEFLPSLSRAGFACKLIVRDPRDMIASQIYGAGPRYAGSPRPLLFLARQWRKSVAFGLAGMSGIELVRFEDIQVRTTAYPANTSFDNAPGRAGRFEDLLPAGDRAFIEALCHAEMNALGYEPHLPAEQIGSVIDTGPDTEYADRETLRDYLYTADRRAEEADRRSRLVGDSSFAKESFLFKRSYEVLRQSAIA